MDILLILLMCAANIFIFILIQGAYPIKTCHKIDMFWTFDTLIFMLCTLFITILATKQYTQDSEYSMCLRNPHTYVHVEMCRLRRLYTSPLWQHLGQEIAPKKGLPKGPL